MSAVVVGGGLAGSVAALALAEQGIDVTLVRRGPGATALVAGTLDVAAASSAPGGLPIRDPLRGDVLSPAGRLLLIRRTRPAHPYNVLLPRASGEAALETAIKEAAARLDGWLRPAGVRVVGDVESTRWLADLGGTVRAADLAFTGPAEGDLREAREIALVAIPGLAQHDARPAARRLAAELAAAELPARSVRAVPARLPEGLFEAAGSPGRLAAHLESSEGLEGLRRAAAGLGAPGRLLLFPPILGMGRVGALLEAIRETSGCRVAELLGEPPVALAGFRLERALAAALERAGVHLVRGEATGVERIGGRVAALAVEAGGRTTRLTVRALVLATGRFTGGGVRDRNGRLVESLLGLPLFEQAGRRIDGEPPHRWLDRNYLSPQPLFSAGVVTDDRLRPLGSERHPAVENVFAAGDLLGGFDPAVERTGLGVALLSGLRAAAEVSRLVAAEQDAAC